MKNSLRRYRFALWTYRLVFISFSSLPLGMFIAFEFVSWDTKALIFNWLFLGTAVTFALGIISSHITHLTNLGSPLETSTLLMKLDDRDFGDSPQDLQEKSDLMTYLHYMIRMCELDRGNKVHRLMYDSFQIQSFKDFMRVMNDTRSFYDFFFAHEPITFENKQIQEVFEDGLKHYRRNFFFGWSFVRHCRYHGLKIQIPELAVCEKILEETPPDRMDALNRIHRGKAKQAIPEPLVSY